MGNCITACLEGPPQRRAYEPHQQHPHSPNGGRLVAGSGGGLVSPDSRRPPTFHHPQFRHINDDEDCYLDAGGSSSQQRGHQPGGGGGGGGVSGESTRIGGAASAQQYGGDMKTPSPQQQGRMQREWPASGSTAGGSSTMRRTPGSGQHHSHGGMAPMRDDLQTVVVRQGTNEKSTLIRTPRSSLTGRSTAGGRGSASGTPRSGAGGGRATTPRAGGGGASGNRVVENDPYADGDGASTFDGDEGEMVLVCADCFVDIMGIDEGRAPARCSVTGKMHV